MTRPRSARRIVLGHIASAHGIRGDVMVRAHTGDPGDLGAYGPLSDATGTRTFAISSLRVTPKGVVVHLAGIDDRTAAEALRGQELTVDRSALPASADGAYYHVDLIGLAAVSPGGTPIGTVVSVQNFGAGDLLEIQQPDVRESVFVPFTDSFVPSVDIGAGRLTVIPPDTTGEPEPSD